jgi:serine/threonine protein kinase
MSFLREPNAEPIPGYRLIEPLGSGGFGEAWKCEAPGGLNKAIKFVFGNLNSLDVDGARAEQELHALNRVKEVRHPFVLSMDRIEVVEGELVIVMELADRNLHDAFEESVAAGLVGIPRDALLRYVRDAAEALDHMNEKHNLQHLDIKPRNLFLVSDRVKVADFGLVKHLGRAPGSGILGGVTPIYAPPETFNGTISGRSDQYSLAIVYVELLTGQRPFTGKNARQLAQQHLNEEPDLRALPEAERPVVARALAKDPNKRFPNCLAFIRALYTARSPSRVEIGRPESEESRAKRPKTMVDTLESVFLEQLSPNGQVILAKDDETGSEEVPESQLGMTVAQPQTGSLRPTLVVGIGSFGRRALLELRCRLLDRFGDLEKVPLLRFLYVDTDTDACRAATRGAPEVAFKQHEVYHLPLQPIAHYRRRQLDQLNEWLPREKLYALPRSLKTQGSRALGRLAFTDNYQRFMARLKREIQQACNPDAVYQTVSQTGLALRDNVPRCYVVGCASGGSSGCLADLGYALRRMLQQMRQPESPVNAMLFCGAPDDPATPPAEQANVYATLTELHHFTDPSVPFAAQYGADGPRLVAEGPAFDHTYLLTLSHRTPEARRDAMAHLGSYLFHELVTPLGLRLDRCRLKHGPADATAFRSLGTYAVWFPRGLMLRLAARAACQHLFEEWQAPDELTARDELEAACARVLAEPELQPEVLATSITSTASEQLEGTPAEALTRLLATIEEQSQQFFAQDDPGSWARQALTRVREWLGSGVQEAGALSTCQRKSRLTRALLDGAARVAEAWTNRLAETAFSLMEHPGRRLAVAEAALARFVEYAEEAAAAHEANLRHQAQRSGQALDKLQAAAEQCANGGGFGWFGNRVRRLLRVFLDHLAAYARQCLAEDTSAAVGQFFVFLRGRLTDQIRDMTFCRQRLRHVQDAFGEECNPLDEPSEHHQGTEVSPSPVPVISAEAFWEAIRESGTTRVVLPTAPQGRSAHAPRDLEQAARRFLTTLTTEQWTQLDQALQEQVLAPRGGLYRACMNSGDLIRHLAAPLVDQTVACLGEHLPITDVAQAELALADTEEGDVAARIRAYHANALPLIRSEAGVASGVFKASGVSVEAPPAPEDQQSFLLIPASESGKAYGEEALRVLPDVNLVTVPGQADLTFCREQRWLTFEDLERILQLCRRAYEETAPVPTTSPHARFDIVDWTPLNP